MQPVVLFDKWQNPMNAGATLSEPVQNFRRVEFQFRTNDYEVISETLFEPTSAASSVLASCAKYVPGEHVYLKTKAYTVQGTSVKTQQSGSSYSCGQLDLTTGDFEFGDFITVTKVMGWR